VGEGKQTDGSALVTAALIQLLFSRASTHYGLLLPGACTLEMCHQAPSHKHTGATNFARYVLVGQSVCTKDIVSTGEEKSPPNLISNSPVADSSGFNETKRIVIPDPHHSISDLETSNSVRRHFDQPSLLGRVL